MATATQVQNLTDQISAKHNRIAERLSKKHADGTFDLTTEQAEEVGRINVELNTDLMPKFENFKRLQKIEADSRAASEAMKSVQHPVGFGGGIIHGDGFTLTREGRIVAVEPMKGIGDLFLESKGYATFKAAKAEGFADAFKNLNISLPTADVKTLFARSAGWDPFVSRRDSVVLSAQQAPTVADLFPVTETGQAAVKWMLETLYTNAAAERAEGGAYAESAFQLTEQSATVQSLGVMLPYTEEQMEDEARSRDYLNNRLTLNLRQRLDLQLLVGNGTAPNLRGLMNVVGLNTQAKGGGDTDFDVILRAITKAQTVGFANPNAIIMHPTDWMNMRLIRANGVYLLGAPADSVAPRIWGLPITTTTYMAQGQGVTGDFVTFSELCYRRGITFDTTNSHGTDFANGIQRMRASLRVVLIVTRPAAFTSFSGLTGS